MTERLPYPPPWQDLRALCEHICVSPNTVENWVKEGILPPARKKGGKLMWKWSEVDEYLTRGVNIDAEAERIKNGTRQEISAGH